MQSKNRILVFSFQIVEASILKFFNGGEGNLNIDIHKSAVNYLDLRPYLSFNATLSSTIRDRQFLEGFESLNPSQVTRKSFFLILSRTILEVSCSEMTLFQASYDIMLVKLVITNCLNSQ